MPGGHASPSQGISVEVGERQSAIDVQLDADYGVAVTDLARPIRRNVISAIERTTSLEVTEVQDVFLETELGRERRGRVVSLESSDGSPGRTGPDPPTA